MPGPSNNTIKPHLNEWNDSLTGDYLWSNVNFGEAVTEVMTPLTWSVIQFTLDDWIFLPKIPTVGIIGGRPYLNISIFATLFYGMGRSRADLLRYMESTLYMHLPESMPIPGIPVGRRTLIQGMVNALRVRWKQHRGVQRTQSYLDANKAWFEGIRDGLKAQHSGRELDRLWHNEMKSHIKNAVWCVLGSVTYSADYTLGLRRELAKIVGPEDATTLIANLSESNVLLESLGPLAGLHKLARGEITQATYLETYGHRGPQEFELSVPRPAEDPSWLERELAKIQQTPVDVSGLIAKQRQAFETAWMQLQRQSPKAASKFKRQVNESVRRARLRELARSAYVRDRWAIRLFALRVGELTGLGDQVFFLTLGELLSILAGDQSGTSAIESRREMYQKYQSLPSYPPVIRGPFDPFRWSSSLDRPTAVFDAQAKESVMPDLANLVGSPGSSGIVEGFVRVVRDPGNEDGFRQGEIMVATQTDIAWTLLFPRAAAIITDIGAPLSHAAIVARELGIPAVVGCGNATDVLKTGDKVRVDGGRGTITILARRNV